MGEAVAMPMDCLTPTQAECLQTGLIFEGQNVRMTTKVGRPSG